MQENKIIWKGCYEESWKDAIVPEAFSHPAKMSYGLLLRILEHAKQEGWIKEGQTIIDPFGGIGSTGILGAYEGYQVVCVELEERFTKLAEQNFQKHDNAWSKLGCPRPIMIQGDSRRLCELLSKADLVVSSPPFSQRQPPTNIDFAKLSKTPVDKYGSTPGQLGAMPAGDLVISSPPYAEAQEGGGISAAMRGTSKYPSKIKGTIGQKNQGYAAKNNNKANLGNLKAGDLIISSPPYEGSLQKGCPESKWNLIQQCIRDGKGHVSKKLAPSVGVDYGQSKGQLGQEQDDTFWSAAKLIIDQCYQILKPGGHAIWVCKDFVRKGKRVPFSKDWSRLCESVGFKLVHWHKATLVKETEHKTLFGHTETKRKERKSFFRRLAESKGSPRIDEEDVLCMQRQGQRALFPS